MPRTLTRASQVYPARPGDPYGPFVVDSFTQDNTDLIRITFTREAWPGVPSDNVVQVSVQWNDGNGARWELPGGVVLGKDGSPLLVQPLSITVPEVSDGQGGKRKRNVVSGTVNVIVRQNLRTAITIEAI